MKTKTSFLRNHWANFNQFFYVSLHGYIEMKIYQHDAGHMTKMAPMPIYCINPLKYFSRIQRADFDETWYESLETQAYYILFK